MSFLMMMASAFLVIMSLMTLTWLVSVRLKNASMVDPIWGLGYVLTGWFYFFNSDGGLLARKWLVVTLVTIWGIRLCVFLAWRLSQHGEEDSRYQNFRQRFGPERYWWFSFFQVFLLQGSLMLAVSATLLGGMYSSNSVSLTLLDGVAVLTWLFGFAFEAGGDWQLTRFKADPANRGKLLDSGFWRYTRHPNYFGDACVWWSFALFSLAAGNLWPMFGAVVMTFLLLRISGVTMLERTLTKTKPGYADYVATTSAFLPWFPKKS